MFHKVEKIVMRKLVSDVFNFLYKVTNSFWVSYLIAVSIGSFLFYFIFSGLIEVLSEGFPILASITPYVILPKGIFVYVLVFILSMIFTYNPKKLKEMPANTTPDYIKIILYILIVILLLLYKKIEQFLT